MKKLIAGLFAAILTTAGLVAVTSAPSSAACTRYVCNNTQPVKPKPQNNVKAGSKPKPIKVDVKVRGGNIAPKGTVTVVIKGPGGFSKTIKVAYKGKAVNVALPKLKKAGTYKVTISFKGGEGFRDSKTTTSIKVKKGR